MCKNKKFAFFKARLNANFNLFFCEWLFYVNFTNYMNFLKTEFRPNFELYKITFDIFLNLRINRLKCFEMCRK